MDQDHVEKTMATCKVCQTETTKKCDACRAALRCSKGGQRVDWRQRSHRQDCKMNESLPRQVGPATESHDIEGGLGVKFPTSKIESVSEEDVCTLSQGRIGNFARDMDTGLLMEYRPYGHGYPDWVGDWIPVGEPLESTDESGTDKDDKKNDKTKKQRRSDQPGRTNPGEKFVESSFGDPDANIAGVSDSELKSGSLRSGSEKA